jgi:glutamyl-tRNA reductase
MQREIVIVGVNHHSAPVEVRERLAVSDEQIGDALQRLVQNGAVEEGAILSTCNRVEIVAASSRGDQAVESLIDFLAAQEHLPRAQLTQHLSVYRGRDAVRHLFRVAASLDSMVVGEPQILGQLKELYGRAAGSGTVGTVLHRCFHKSFSVAKRVRSETGVASKAVSVSSAAVELAGKIFDHLHDKTAMLIGAGTMSELAARHLMAQGVRSMLVANRTFDRAVELARELHATAVPFEEIDRYLELADVVIGSTSADEYVLDHARIQHVLRQRKYRPMFLIDVSVPRNFDPRINDLDNVYLYDIDDLGAVAQENLEERVREADKAEVIVDAEVDAFQRWLLSLDAVPTIVALRDKVESIRQAELQKLLSAFPAIDQPTRDAIDQLTTAIVNKILHAPIKHLKSNGARREALYLDAARHLFDIDESEES